MEKSEMIENSPRIRIKNFCSQASLLLTGIAIIIRLFLPGMTVEIGENVLVMLICFSALLFLALGALLDENSPLPHPVLAFAVFSLILIPLVSIFWAGDKVRCLTISGLWVSDIALFSCVCCWGRKPRVLSAIMAAMLACMAIETLYALYQYFIALPGLRTLIIDNPRIIDEAGVASDTQLLLRKLKSRELFGHFTLSNSLGGYLIAYLPVLLLLLKNWKTHRIRAAVLLALSLSATWALWLSCSRGAIVALIAALFLSGGWRIFRKSKGKPLAAFSLGIFAASLVTCWMCVKSHCLDFIGQQGFSLLMRIAYWKSAVHIFCEHPFLGVGIGNFRYYYYAHKVLWAEEVDSLHNCYLQLLVETGLLGFIALALAAGTLGYFLLRAPKSKAEPPVAERSGKEPMMLIVAAPLSFLLLSFLGYLWEIEPLLVFLRNELGNDFYHHVQTLAPIFEWAMVPVLAGVWLGFFSFFRKWREELLSPLGIGIGILAFALHSTIDMDYYVPTLSQNLWLLIALIAAQKPNIVCRRKVKNALRISATLCASLAVFCISALVLPRLFALAQLKKELPKSMSDFKHARSPEKKRASALQYRHSLEKALVLGPWDYSLNQAKVSMLLDEARLRAYRGESPQRLLKIFALADHYGKRAIQYRPHWAPGYYARALSYRKQAEVWRRVKIPGRAKIALNLAKKNIEKALALYPTKARNLTLAGTICQDGGKKAQALEYYRKALYMNDMGAYLWKKMPPEKRDALIDKVAKALKKR